MDDLFHVFSVLSYEDNFLHPRSVLHRQISSFEFLQACRLVDPFSRSSHKHDFFSSEIFDSMCYPWCLAGFNCFKLVGNEVGINV